MGKHTSSFAIVGLSENNKQFKNIHVGMTAQQYGTSRLGQGGMLRPQLFPFY